MRFSPSDAVVLQAERVQVRQRWQGTRSAVADAAIGQLQAAQTGQSSWLTAGLSRVSGPVHLPGK